MQAAVGWSALPHHRTAPETSLHRPSVPSPALRGAYSLTLALNCKSNSAKVKASFRVPSCRCSSSSWPSSTSSSSSSHADWDWAKWNRHFSEIDQAESFLSVLKFQLEEAIENEDFLEAAKLKKSIAEATSKDVVAEVMFELKSAIEEQRYHDASRLSRLAGTGLIGWWVGHAKDSDDSFGRILRITPEVGRYVARSYSPRQLLVKSSGTPLFEIFLLKDDDGKFTMKVVSLQATKVSKQTIDIPSIKQETGDSSSTEKDNNALPQDNGISEKPNDNGEEALKSLISFLKDRIPSFKVQVLNYSGSEEVEVDMDSVQQLIEDDDEEEEDNDDEEEENNDDDEEEKNEASGDAGDHNEDVSQDGSEIGSDQEESDKVKLFIGGVLHNREDVSSVAYRRVPAEVRCIEKDSFVLHVPGKGPKGGMERRMNESDITVGDIIAQVASDLMPSDVAKAFLGVGKGGPKGKKAKDMQAIPSFAFSELQHRFLNRLSENTIFNRISVDADSFDPFTGLYVGSFGPYGPEVVQLRRKYGHWGSSDEASSGLEFFEYVEAVKLTGDINVPAGQVTFRAKIGKGNRVMNDGIFPEGLGVTSFYSGQGRTARPGFENPQWVQGELLELNGKGMGPIKGAELGFLYIIPDQSFLVLFNRLHLPR